MSHWNYRLVKEKDKRLPRICEVFYNDNEEPQFYSPQSIFENLYWALIVPIRDIFKRGMLRDTDMVPDKETEEMDKLFENMGTCHVVPVKKDNDIYYIDLPQDITPEGWEIDDTIRWDEVENCTDYGEYPSWVLVNESLEERMKASD